MARILAVDDQEGVRTFLAEALELDGHEVDQAVDGADALSAARRTAYDVVLTDLNMPKLDGMTLLRHLREEQPEVEVILLTAHGTVSAAVEAMRQGAFDFLEKPIGSPAELRLLVDRAVERRRLRTVVEGASRLAAQPPPLTYGDPAMAPVVSMLEKVAPTDATVLLTGESGTGKEVAARALHARSKRSGGPFVAINCAALSETLLESELFGHEKGAFTGAHQRRRGRLELAEGGTFFLDEVGEIKLPLQAKLLRVIEERQFERVGGNQTLQADVRWVAATNRDLGAMIADGTFREDLYHRLAVFPIQLPSLRDRRADIVPLAEQLLARVAAELGRTGLTMSDDVRETLRRARWTGNVRELRNTLERAVILAEGRVIDTPQLVLDPRSTAASAAVGELETLEDIERRAILATLRAVGGNRKDAAERLGIGLRTLYERLKRYGEAD